jgi:hypothetical protein
MLNQISGIWGGLCARPGSLIGQQEKEEPARMRLAGASVHTTHTVCPRIMPLGTCTTMGKQWRFANPPVSALHRCSRLADSCVPFLRVGDSSLSL